MADSGVEDEEEMKVADVFEPDSIDENGVECFESQDFREEEVKAEPVDDEEEEEKPKKTDPDPNVIEERIQPSEAFQIYAGQLFDPQAGSIRKTTRSYGTSNSKDANFESPLQTFKRLEYEIEDFRKRLDDIAKRAKQERRNPVKQVTQDLNRQLGNLWSNVENFKNDAMIKPLFTEANAAVLDTVDSNYLFKRLEEFQAQKMDGKSEVDSKGRGDKGKAVFTLYHDGSVNNQSYRVSDINSRLSNMEAIIGRKPDNAAVGDMTRSIEYLSSVLALLSDDLKLDALVRRAQVLRKKLQEIQSRGHDAIELQITKTKEEKINKLFDMMTRWDAAALQLPTVVDRLRSVKNVHEESANIVQKVNNLETQNKLIADQLSANRDLLGNVQASLAQNANLMAKNMKTIQDRMDRVQESMKKLGI